MGETPALDSSTAHMRHRHAKHDFAPLGAVVGACPPRPLGNPLGLRGEPAQRTVSQDRAASLIIYFFSIEPKLPTIKVDRLLTDWRKRKIDALFAIGDCTV